MTLYALRLPTGKLVEETVTGSQGDTWSLSFEFLSENGCGPLLGRHSGKIFLEVSDQKGSHYYCRRFWGKRKASQDYARKHGHRVVPVVVREK